MFGPPLQRKRALASAIVLAAVCGAYVPAESAPCIDTNRQGRLVSRTMKVQQAGRTEVPVTGSVASLDTVSGELGLKVAGLDGEQRIKDAVIRLETLEPSMQAQTLVPHRASAGPISAELPLATLSVDQGVIRYPGCMESSPENEFAFTGTLTLGNGKLKVDGEFFEYTPGEGGSGGPGVTGGKRG